MAGCAVLLGALGAVGQAVLGFLGAPGQAMLGFWEHRGWLSLLGTLGQAVLGYWEHGEPWSRLCWFPGSAGSCGLPLLWPPPRVVSPLCYGSWTPHLAAPPRCLVAAVTAARKHIPGPPRGPPDPAWSRSSQGRGQAGGPARSRGGWSWFPQPMG